MVCYILLEIIFQFFIYVRGTEFRKEFGRLGDLHGFFPPSVHFMALTATASNSVQKHITRLLGMSRPQMVIRSPDKPNICYSVSEKCSTLEEIFKPLIEELRVSRINTKRTIVTYTFSFDTQWERNSLNLLG